VYLILKVFLGEIYEKILVYLKIIARAGKILEQRLF